MSATASHDSDLPTDVTQHLLGVVARRQDGRPRGQTSETLPVERARPGERLQYALRERNLELELRQREWEAARSLYEMEFRTQEIAARVQMAYVAQLEANQGELHLRLEYEGEVRAGLTAEIDRLRAEVAGLSGLLAAVRSRRAYRLVNRAVPIIRTVLYPVLVARRALRRLMKRSA